MTDMIVRKTTSTFSSLPLKCTDICPFPLLFKSLLSEALDPRKTGCPLSPKLIIMILAKWSYSPFGLYVCVPYHFGSDPGPRNDQWLWANLLAYSATLRAFATHNIRSLFSPYNVVVHWHEDDSSWELLRLTAKICTVATRAPSALHRFDPILFIEVNSETKRSSPSKLWRDFDWSHTQYWVGECIGFCSWQLNSLVSDQSRPLPSLMLPVDHGYSLDFILILDQLSYYIE